MATTKNESFKNLTEYLKKLKELDDTAVKNNSIIDELKSSTIFSAAGNKEPTTKVEEKSTPASLNKFNEKILKNEEDKDKLFREINDNLKEIKKALKGDTPYKRVGGGPGRSDTSPGALPKADNVTFTEKLKSAVAGVKGAGNKVMGLGEKIVGATGGAVQGLVDDPKGFAKKAFSSLTGAVSNKAGSIGNYVKEVASTKSDYTPEQERFAKIAVQATKLTTKLTPVEAGEAFNKVQAKSGEIEQHKAEMDKFKEQGFEPTDDQKKKLNDLQKELAAVDPRVKKDDTDKREAKVESKQERDVSEQALAAFNPNADNVESSSEKISKEIADNNKTISSLLAVATSQLTSLNVIKDALAPSNPKEQQAKGQKPREPDVTPGGEAAKGGLLDTVGDLANLIPGGGGSAKPTAAKPTMGSKIAGAFKGMSGLAKASGVLAVGVGAYDAYSNYKEAGAEGQAKLEQIDADVKAGKITPKEAEDLKKQTNEATVERKGEGIGSGAGTAIGGALGAVAGSVLGPVGTIAGGYLGAKAGEFIGGKVGKLGGQVANYFSGNKNTPVDSAAPIASTINNSTTSTNTSESKTRIAGEDVGEKLSDKQMAVIGMSKGMGNNYSPEVEAKYANQSKTSGSDLAKTSTENNDMEREASKGTGGNNTVVSNNVSSNNTTKYVPMKASPRPESQGSALDRYQNRITVY